jgi:serine/threonine protein kinase
MHNRFELVNEVVEEALDLPAAERETFVSARCAPDESLLADALRLLAISDSMDGFPDCPPASLPEIRPGDVLGGRFRILERLGAGGMGSIFLAEDKQLGQVALKALHPEMRGDPRAMQLFLAEIGNARAIRHPNICPVFDLFTFDHAHGGPLAAFTMKYLSGETLACRLSRGAIPAADAMQIARGIGAGIDALHAEGIVHRDLKPDNIMLTTGRDGLVAPVIMDFGLASQPGTAGPATGSETVFAAISGSPDYMAPEQFRTASPAKPVDIYAFGLILFETIAGSRPFPREDLLPAAIRRTTEDAPRLRSVAPRASRGWDCAIARALSRDPSQRPRSARELVDEIEGASARRETRAGHIEGRCRHQPHRASIRRRRSSRRPCSIAY